MSREIQLRPIKTSLPAAPDELFGGPGAGLGPALPPVGAPQPTPGQKLHRLLKGRYAWAVLLALAGGVVGAVAGWYSQRAEFMSEGMLEIQPTIQSVLNNDKTMPFYDKFLNSQPNTITSSQVIERAMQQDNWKKMMAAHPDAAALYSDPVEGINNFKSAMTAAIIRGSQNVRVTFTDVYGDVAQEAVRSVIQSYKELYQDVTGQTQRSKLLELEKQINDKDMQVRKDQQQVLDLTKEYPTSAVQEIAGNLAKKLRDYQEEKRVAELELAAAEANMKEKQDGKLPDLTPEEIAEVDDTMRNMLQQRVNKQYNLEMLRQRLGENHRQVQDAVADLALAEKYIKLYAESYAKTFVPPAPNIGGNQPAAPLTERELAARRGRVALLTTLIAQTETDAKHANDIAHSVAELQNQIANNQKDLDKYNQILEVQLAQAPSIAGNVRVVSNGEIPVPATDGRKKMAFVGFVGGASLPVMLLLMIGLLDHRYRYSDEATYDLSGITLLGILPNLPDRLTDPEQAATAAHCVHQIRTMLQINGRHDEPQVYAVTSAAAGDGKTSLTLALGLSFAASGSRTLLVDCDIVGAGLTARLDMAGPDGILEAMSDRSLLQHIRTTDIADLAMLPVGMAQAHHAGMFSPAALRKLVTEAKKHFEVVLIDTGPILGSIEATPVCSAADAVILTVSRGQQRPTVEKALSHLLSIGARFAGVVFNRAQARDFERSISGMSLRSIARANGHGPNRGNGHPSPFNTAAADTAATKAFGPVARAVASSVQAEEDDRA